MRQAANYNVHATESLPQSLALHFISPSGEDVDISGMTLRGAVVQDGVIMLDCAVTGASAALVTWPRLAAGCGAYDIFLTDASGKEYPLLKGAVHVVSRVTPPDGTEEAAAVAGALDVSIPETEDGSVTIVENPSIVVEELVRQAEAARDEAKRFVETLEGQVKSGELVNEAVANKLPAALKDAGVELEAATGQSTLSSGDAADTWTIVGGYAMTWGDEILAGHLPDSCRLTSISTVYFFTDPALNQYCLRIWRLTDGAYSLIGTSAYVSNLSSGQTATWVFTPGVILQRGDKIIIQVCEGTEMTPYALGMHAVLTPSVPGRGLVTEVANPPTVNGTMAPLMTVVVDYDDGITLGGMELATARQLDSLGRDVRQSSAIAEAAARTAGQSAATASTSASDAATSATAAANAATAAQQALEAMPQVDASGNMTLAGGLTAAGAVNANGGINIPLAVGAATDTAAVNRMYAAGMAGVTGILTSNAFLNTDAITASGSSTVTKTVPYHLAGIKIPKGTHSTIQAKFEVSNPQWNYSSFAGFSFLWRATNAAKLSFGIGRGTKTVRPDLSIDSYSIIPANGLAYNHGEILDITFDNVRNTERNGYTVRVREIFALNNTDSWQVKTTTSFIPASQNEPVPWTVCKVVYQQKSVASIARYEDTGALWLMLTGGQGYNLYQIATCRGVSNFETGVGISSWVTDVVNNAGGDVSVYAGIGEYTYYQPGGMNPVFYSLEAVGVNAIESEETAGFEDINVPLES
ncbi:hypothetical protein ADH72_07135 [Akkermansia muciniphila]|uniref:hypothetical protein n=5 Tax=Akkermansia muciniphila TaxID=239935 RepID=UPI0009C1BB34|nr:hypothetical protein [Akkermansia muciniphila]ANU61986.2 hypothetical protein A4V05_11400 [Akkermansia muciniphila]ASB35479.1 hypothetical protein ADH72_07135 [Akkermansia muciniphila]QQR32926.1 hypothetical protein I5Q85_09815 [Akkermansia muciniphila]WAK79040.1 hypothetical protein [Akkermansia phage Chantilly]